MRRPRRWRNIALAFLAAGLVACLAAFLVPDGVVGDTVRGLGFAFGLTAVLFGGGVAIVRHLDARAQDSLARGEDVLARWHVDADTWRAFVAYDRQLSQDDGFLPNELPPGDSVPAAGLEIIVGLTAVQIGESIHRLPRRGTPEVTHAELNKGRVRPSFVDLRLYYPGGGAGASGVPARPVRTSLRFPVPNPALHEAERAVALYAAGRPGNADFFHGVGDGSDPEDASTCWACGYQTHRFVSHCPQCRATMQSRRWSRRFGKALVVCGAFIAAVVGIVLYVTAPMLLRPGVDVGGTRFSGSTAQAVAILGILAIVFTFGVTTMLYGAWQVRSGGRSRRIVLVLLAIFGLLGLIAMVL